MGRLQVVEQAKAGSPDICVRAFFHLFQSSGDIGAQLNGLTLLRHVLRNRWDALSPEQQQELEQYITSIALSPDTSKHASPIRMQLAYVISDVAVQSGDRSTDNILKNTIPQLVQQSKLLLPLAAPALRHEAASPCFVHLESGDAIPSSPALQVPVPRPWAVESRSFSQRR